MTLLNTKQNNSEAVRFAGLPRKRRFELMRWVLLVASIYVLAVVLNLLIFNDAWNWQLVGAYLFHPRVLLGVLNTIWLTALALFFGLLTGLIVCAAQLSGTAILRVVAFVYVWFARATPALVILLVIYFLGVLKPTLGVGIPLLGYMIEWPTNDLITPFNAAVVGLSFYLGGKSAEIFRSGYLSVSAGQHEAAKALGLAPWTALTRVIGPQSLRVLTPPLANEVVTIFKNTSLVSVVGYAELLTTVQRLYAVNFETIPMLTVACVWYLALTSILMTGQLWLERRFGRGYVRRATITASNDGRFISDFSIKNDISSSLSTKPGDAAQ